MVEFFQGAGKEEGQGKLSVLWYLKLKMDAEISNAKFLLQITEDNIARLTKQLLTTLRKKAMLLKRVHKMIEAEEQLKETLRIEIEKQRSLQAAAASNQQTLPETVSGVEGQQLETALESKQLQETLQQSSITELSLQTSAMVSNFVSEDGIKQEIGIDSILGADSNFLLNTRDIIKHDQSLTSFQQTLLNGILTARKSKEAVHLRQIKSSVKRKRTVQRRFHTHGTRQQIRRAADNKKIQDDSYRQRNENLPKIRRHAEILPKESETDEKNDDRDDTDQDTPQTCDDESLTENDMAGLTCTICKRSFKKKNALAVHMQTHGETALDCSICGVKFRWLLQLKKHMKRVHALEWQAQDQSSSFVCGKCGKDCFTAVRYSAHMRKHGGIRPYACSECPKRYASAKSLGTHIRVHMGDLQHLCNICGKCFGHVDNLRQHIQSHTRLYHCDKCPRTFSRSTMLNEHQRQHAGDTPHMCFECGKAFTQLAGLRSHSKIHGAVKRHSCPICGHRFHFVGNLNSHMDVHTGERRFACTQCERKFAKAHTLKVHLYSVHGMGEASHACPQCSKMFVSVSGLSVHMRCHADMKPHRCDQCEKSYRAFYDLRKHKQKHHSV